MARKRTATLLYSTKKLLTVPEFFAVGESPTAVLFRAVKGGGSLPLTIISAIFKVLLSLFSFGSFFHRLLDTIFFIFCWTVWIILVVVSMAALVMTVNTIP